MHEFIPTRSRAELKRKFNREEKINETRINEVLVNCSRLGQFNQFHPSFRTTSHQTILTQVDFRRGQGMGRQNHF